MEAMYSRNINIPFSSFVLQESQQTPLFESKSSNITFPLNTRITPPISLIQQAILSQSEEQDPDYQQQYQFQYQNNIKINNISHTNNNDRGNGQNLVEFRKRTIERLRHYNEVHSKLRPQQQQKHAAPLHFGPPKVVKPTPGPLPHITVNPYQRPNAELIKPRITNLQFSVKR